MTATTKFNIDATVNSDSHEDDRTDPTLVGTGTRCKRAAGGTGVLLRDVLINVSLETLVRVDDLARVVREISPDTMTHDDNTTPTRIILSAQSIIRSAADAENAPYTSPYTLYTNSMIPHTKYDLSYYCIRTTVSGSEVAA